MGVKGDGQSTKASLPKELATEEKRARRNERMRQYRIRRRLEGRPLMHGRTRDESRAYQRAYRVKRKLEGRPIAYGRKNPWKPSKEQEHKWGKAYRERHRERVRKRGLARYYALPETRIAKAIRTARSTGDFNGLSDVCSSILEQLNNRYGTSSKGPNRRK